MSNNEKITICVADNCLVPLPEGRKKYCSDRCSKRTRQRAWRASKPTKEYHIDKGVDENVQKRRGDYYAIMKKKNFFNDILEGKKTKKEVANILSCSPSTISRAVAAYLEDVEKEAALERRGDPFELQADVDSFVEFRDQYFLTEQGKNYETPDFQK